MTQDEKFDKLVDRVQALTESVELLASIHKANEIRQNKLQNALMLGVSAFLQELSKKDSQEN